MDHLFIFAAQNTAIALVLAMIVAALSRVWRNPPVAHLLWLLVLLKLVAPPVVRIDWSPAWLAELPPAVRATNIDVAPVAGPNDPDSARLGEQPAVQVSARATTSPKQRAFAAGVRWLWGAARLALFCVWLGGTVLCAAIVVIRIARFERRLRDMLPAGDRVERLARDVAGRLGVRRVPRLCCAECIEGPLLWCAGRRPTIVLPRPVVQLDDDRLALVLAHELAHLRRRDHWVRMVELVVTVAYWWNPLAWIVRRRIHQAEDLCCDAWVRWIYPDCGRRYGEVLLQVAEAVSPSPRAAGLLPASSFLHSHSLKARIEMMLENRFAPHVSRKSLFVTILVALLALPSFVGAANTPGTAGSDDGAQVEQTAADQLLTLRASVIGAKAKLQRLEEKLGALHREHRGDDVTSDEVLFYEFALGWAKTELQVAEQALLKFHEQTRQVAVATSEFPYAVKFEQGATRFEPGDDIQIVEVRGTANSFVPGNLYCIKGTYTLSSRDQAGISAYTTAADSKDGFGVPLKVQSKIVDKGHGTFTLFLPMTCQGWPHVSFYPRVRGESFGGNYFGTGESVLKRWWGE